MDATYTNRWLKRTPSSILQSFTLERFEEGRSRRVFDIITGDKSCFYHYDPQLQEQ